MTEPERWTIEKRIQGSGDGRFLALDVDGPDTDPLEVVPAAAYDTLARRLEAERLGLGREQLEAERDAYGAELVAAREDNDKTHARLTRLLEDLGELRDALDKDFPSRCRPAIESIDALLSIQAEGGQDG